MKPTIELIRRVDSQIKARFVYQPDPIGQDIWTSHAKLLRKDPDYQMLGDCDDLVETVLEELVFLGVDKDLLFRAAVRSPGSHVVDHMIGLVKVGDEMFSVGDTFGTPAKVHAAARRVNAHILEHIAPMRRKFWQFVTGSKPKRRTNNANMRMDISQQGLEDLKTYEEFRAQAYDDARPHRKLNPGDPIYGTLTIGWGHTGPDVKPGMVISEQDAQKLLRADVAAAVRAVREAVMVPLTQNEFDALVSFTFNAGVHAFKKSTLLKRVNSNAPPEEIERQFKRWVYGRVNGKKVVMTGLVNRRAHEAQKFNKLPELCAAPRSMVLAA